MDTAVLRSAFATAVRESLERIVAYLPSLAAGAGLVVAGWLAAWLSRAIVSRVLGGVVGLVSRQPAVGRAIARNRLAAGFVAVASGVVYWLILALFVAAAIEQLELTIAASLVSAFAAYLPRVLVGLAIVFGGMIAGQLAFTAIYRAAGAAGAPQAALLARAVQLSLVFFGIVTAADQIGIQSTLLTVVVGTTIAAVLGGATLAFGLGSGLAVSNIIAVFYILKTYRVGQVVRIGDIQGEIVAINQTGVVIASAQGRVHVPGRRFSEEPSTLVIGDAS